MRSSCGRCWKGSSSTRCARSRPSGTCSSCTSSASTSSGRFGPRWRRRSRHNGLELESISLTGLDQASREHFNPNNAFDAEGLTKLTAEIETRRRARNEIEQDAEVAIQEKNLQAERLKLEIAKQEEHARLQQQKEIAIRRAQQKSEIAVEEAERDRHIEESRVNAREQIELTQITSERIVNEGASRFGAEGA